MPLDAVDDAQMLHAMHVGEPRPFTDAQDMLDRVAWHLFTQRVRSQTLVNDGRTVCAYRGNNGTMCAMGIGIPNDAYTRDMEEQSIELVCSMDGARVFSRVIDDNTELAAELQLSHDTMLTGGSEGIIDHLYGRLLHIAEDHRLDTTQLEAAYAHARSVAR